MGTDILTRWSLCRQSAVRLAGRVGPDVVTPVLFGLFTYYVFRQYSWRPTEARPFITGALLGISGLTFWVMLLLGRRLSLPNRVGGLLVLLAASMTVSLLLSANTELAVQQMLVYVATALFGTSVYIAYRDRASVPLTAYCVAIALVHLPFVLEVMLWAREAQPPFFAVSKSVPNFANVRHFGQMGFVAAVCGTGLSALLNRWGLSAVLLAAAALLGIVAMGSRGAALCWLVYVALLVVFSSRRLRVLAHATLSLAFACGAVWYLQSARIVETPNLFERVAEAPASEGNGDSGRLRMWRDAVHEVVEHPLLGQGPEAYEVSGCCIRRVRQPHNFILQFLMEFGLIGCVLAAAVLWRVTKACGGPAILLSRTRASEGGVVLGAAIVSFAAYGLMDGVLYHTVPLLHVALFLGLYAATLSKHRDAWTALSSGVGS